MLNLGMADDGFGRRQKELRNARGLSQTKLSYALLEADKEEHRGYDPSFIARVERGDRRPPPRYLLLLRRVLDPTLEEFPELYLAEMRRQLDEGEVGLDQALKNFRALEAAATASAETKPRLGTQSLERLLRSAGSTLEAPSAAKKTAGAPKAGRGSRKRAA